MIQQSVEIINRLGLHARAATKLVQCAAEYKATVELEKDGKKVNGKSILGVMMLAAAKGSNITLLCNGDDEQAAATAIAELISNKFGEPE